jgi:hypothetical protein
MRGWWDVDTIGGGDRSRSGVGTGPSSVTERTQSRLGPIPVELRNEPTDDAAHEPIVMTERTQFTRGSGEVSFAQVIVRMRVGVQTRIDRRLRKMAALVANQTRRSGTNPNRHAGTNPIVAPERTQIVAPERTQIVAPERTQSSGRAVGPSGWDGGILRAVSFPLSWRIRRPWAGVASPDRDSPQ